jgi:alpha-beta hydrolase superfamily lysophospholipase
MSQATSQPMPQPITTELTMPDGTPLAYMAWPWRRAGTPRAHMLLVHGLGEHARRYDALAEWLQTQGVAVCAYDQRGHGASGGARATLAQPDSLLDDLDSVWQTFAQTQKTTNAGADLDVAVDGGVNVRGAPLLVLGHSMGGLVVMRWLARGPTIGSAPAPQAAIASSPALGTHANGLELWAAKTLAKHWPNARLSNGLKLQNLSHDPAVVQAYKQDPLVHKYITPRLAQWIIMQGHAAVQAAHSWPLPMLLVYAGADALVDPSATDAFAQAAPSVVHTLRLDGAFHEIFNETPQYRDVALATVSHWLAPQLRP